MNPIPDFENIVSAFRHEISRQLTDALDYTRFDIQFIQLLKKPFDYVNSFEKALNDFEHKFDPAVVSAMRRFIEDIKTASAASSPKASQDVDEISHAIAVLKNLIDKDIVRGGQVVTDLCAAVQSKWCSVLDSRRQPSCTEQGTFIPDPHRHHDDVEQTAAPSDGRTEFLPGIEAASSYIKGQFDRLNLTHQVASEVKAVDFILTSVKKEKDCGAYTSILLLTYLTYMEFVLMKTGFVLGPVHEREIKNLREAIKAHGDADKFQLSHVTNPAPVTGKVVDGVASIDYKNIHMHLPL